LLRTAVETRSYRSATEDRAAVFHSQLGISVVVADGVGGRPDGAAAAERSIGLARAAAAQAHEARERGFYWQDALRRADQELLRDPAVGEVAIVVLSVSAAGEIAGASVGDCEAWVVADGVRSVLSLMRKPYLGCGAATPAAFRGRLAAGSTLLVASDGLFKYADTNSIATAASLPDLADAAAALAELPRAGSGSYPDDLALVLCRYQV
jgi:serine/threonine protein phosphatase PrpC